MSWVHLLTVECVSEWMCRSVRNPRVFWIFRVVTSQSPFHSTFQESQKKFYEKGPDGKHCNVGWPKFVDGLLSDEQQLAVLETFQEARMGD